jgi:hypothetical protein
LELLFFWPLCFIFFERFLGLARSFFRGDLPAN